LTADRPVRTVSFDLDGTLVHGSMGLVLKEVASSLSDGDTDAATELYRELMSAHEALLAAADPLPAYDWDALVEASAQARGRHTPVDLATRAGELARQGGARLVNGASAAALTRLRSAGWRVIVLTNGWVRFQRPVLEAVGLWDAFDDVLTSDGIGHAKPAREAFLAARGDAGLYVHVGDRYDHDIEGAAAVGATTVLLRATAPTAAEDAERRPDFAATTLDEVVGFLEGLPLT